jgi:hypothetical protein
LSGSVDTGIGATGTVKCHRSAVCRLQDFFDFFLHSALVGLPLPAVEVGAQVLDCQGDALG